VADALLTASSFAQEYASRLSRTKGRPRSSAPELDQSAAALDTSTTGTGKIRLLRKQLEEARQENVYYLTAK
jgi:hypothetical protein